MERLTLEAQLDTRAAPALRAALSGMRGSDVVVDASAVQFLGAHCLQWLLLAQELWAKEGRAFSFSSVSDDMIAQARQLGLPDEWPQGNEA